MNPVRAEVDYNVEENSVLVDIILDVDGNIKEELNVTVLSKAEADPSDFNSLLNDDGTEFNLLDYDPELTWDDYLVEEGVSYVFYAYQGEKGNISEGLQTMADNYYWYYYISYETVNEYYEQLRYISMLEELILVLLIAMGIVSIALLAFGVGNKNRDIKVVLN